MRCSWNVCIWEYFLFFFLSSATFQYDTTIDTLNLKPGLGSGECICKQSKQRGNTNTQLSRTTITSTSDPDQFAPVWRRAVPIEFQPLLLSCPLCVLRPWSLASWPPLCRMWRPPRWPTSLRPTRRPASTPTSTRRIQRWPSTLR